jgi:hypothetical protein
MFKFNKKINLYLCIYLENKSKSHKSSIRF